MQKVISFRDAGGELYDIPEDETEAFRRDMPQAQAVRVFRDADGALYDIPEAEAEAFTRARPQAEPVRSVRTADGEIFDVPESERATFLKGYRTEPEFQADREAVRAKVRSAAGPDQSVAAAAARGAVEGLGEFGRDVGRAATRVFTDKIPNLVYKPLAVAAGMDATTVGRWAMDVADDIEQRSDGRDWQKPELEGWAAMGPQAFESILTNLIPAVATGGSSVYAMPALYGLERAHDVYRRATESGKDKDSAVVLAASAGALETGMEALSSLFGGGKQAREIGKAAHKTAGRVLLDNARAFLKKLAKESATEMGTEFIQEGGGALIDQTAAGKPLDVGQALTAGAQAAGSALLATAAQGAGGGLVGARTQAPPSAPQAAIASTPAPATPALPNSPLPVPAFAPEIAARVPLLDTSALPPSPFAAPPKPQLGPTLKAAETLMVNRQVVEGWEAAKQRRDQEIAQQAADAKQQAIEHRQAVRAGAESKAARARRLSLDSFWEQHHGTFGGLPMIERILAGQVFRAPTKRSGGEYDAWKALGEKYPELRMMMSRKTDTGIPIDVAALQENMEPEQMVAQIAREWEEYQAWKERDGRTPEDLHDEEIAAEAEYNLTTPVEVAPAALKPGDMVRTPDGQWRRVEREPDTVILADGTDIALPEESAEKLALQAHVPAGQPGIDEARQAYTEQERAMWAEAERERIAAENAAPEAPAAINAEAQRRRGAEPVSPSPDTLTLQGQTQAEMDAEAAARQTEAQRQEMLARAAAPLPASTGDQTAVLPGMEGEVDANLFDAADIEARRALDLPPIETQAVAEQKPVEQSAPTTAPASKPPELMTPEEYNRGILSLQTGFGSGVQPILVRRDSGGTEWIETGIKGEPYNGNPTTFLRSLETGKERLWPVNEVSRMPTFAASHKDLVADAARYKRPVSALAVDAYGTQLPPGYVREGERYVFKTADIGQTRDFALTARRMVEAGSVRGPKGTEWNVRDERIEVAHSVTGREMGTIDLETGEVTPQKTSDKDVLEAIANEIRAQSKTYANEAELDRLKQYPFKPRNAARIKELEAQAPAQDLRAAAAAAGGGEQETGTNPTGPTIIDRSTDARPGWTTEYSSSDFGTERLVTVRDDKGNIIGQRDPFMGGIPVNPKRRTARIRQVAKEIVRDYDSAMERQAREAAAPSSAPAAPESPAQDIQSAAAAAGRSGAARGMAQADGTGLPGQMEAPDAAAVPADNPHYSIFPIELPEAVDFARQATGKFPKVKKRIRLLGGTALGVYRSTAQGPLGIELKRSIFNLITDQDRARIAAEAEAWAAVNLEGNPEGELWTSAVQDRITEETDKLREQRLKENPRLASSVLLHEVGHWIDNVPDYETMMKRGNILGHLQALHGYTKQMMMEHPDTLEAAIRPRERARMRREAERAAGRRPADDAERKVWSEEVSTHYQDMLQEEAARRGLVTRAQILSELEPLIAWWHGTDSIPEYFTDPAEMYADAFSVLANNPAAMRKRAPTYFKVWQNWLAKRPQARELWERYQMDATLGRVGDMRDRRQMEGIEAANFEHEKQLRARMVWSPRQNLDALGSMLYSGAYPITRRAKKLMKRGVESGDRMMKALQDERYRHAWGAAYMMEVQDKVGRRVFAEAGVPLAEWRAFLQNRQIAENRQGIASMMGMNPAASSEALERQRQRMGDAAYNAMMQAQAQWHALRQKYVINLALEKGLVTQELADMMEQRAAYSHVAAVDADVDPVEAIFRGAYGEAGAKIYKQEGFLGLARDPWQATLELDRSLITAAYRNELKAALESMLADSGEELYRDAGTKWDANVKRMVPVTGESARASTLVYMRNGKPRSYWAPQEIVDFVDNADPVSARVLTSLINTLLRKQKGVFTWLNYGFPIFNTPRDIQDWIRNLPGWKGRLTYYHYAKRARPLVQSIVDGRPTEEAAELMRQNILLLYPQGLEPGQDRFLQSLGQKIGGRVGRALEATGPQTALERTIQGYGLRPEWMGMDVNTRQDLMQRVKRWYLSPTEKGEMLRKVSAWLYLRDRFPDMSAEDVQRNVQMMGGSPDFADRARKNAVIDAVFPFYNPFLRGWQSALTAFAREPVRVTLTTMRYGVVPKLILAAIGAGYMRELLKRLLGDLGDKIGKEQQKMVQYIPQYYKDNYAVHPLWWDPTDPTGTKVVFETSPLSEFNRFAGATIWSLLDGGDIKSILDVGAEQLPGINPVLTLASQWAQVYSGRPPAGTGITQTQIDAGAAVSPMMRETWNQLSGGMLGRIPREGIGDVNLSPLEKFLRLPGVSNTLGRRLRVSNKGFSEGLREAAKPAERERAKVRTEAWRDALEYARTGTLPVEAAVRQARGAMTMAMKPDGRDTSSYLALLPVEQSRDAYYVERLHDYMLQMNIAKLAPREQAMLKAPWTQKAELLRGYGKPPVDKPSR